MVNFEEIYKEYFTDVFLYIKGLSANANIAEEITQETFFKAMIAIDKFKYDCKVKVWLCSIAKNCYFTYLKKQNKIFNDELKSHTDYKMNIEIDYLDKESMNKIHSVLHKTKEPYKEVFMLRVFGELSFKQIGNLFEKTDHWACITYHRAKTKILSEMEK